MPYLGHVLTGHVNLYKYTALSYRARGFDAKSAHVCHITSVDCSAASVAVQSILVHFDLRWV